MSSTNSLKDLEILCDLCQEDFSSDEEISYHKIVYHNFSSCKFCHNSYENINERKNHEILEHYPLICIWCNECFLSYKVLNHHILKVHGCKICDFCTEKIYPKEIYLEHLSQKHKITAICKDNENTPHLILDPKNENQFLCKLCDKHLPVIFFYMHYKDEHNIKNYILLNIINKMGIKEYIKNKLDYHGTQISKIIPNCDAVVDSCKVSTDNTCKFCGHLYSFKAPREFHDIYCSGNFHCSKCNSSFDSIHERENHLGTEHFIYCPFGCTNMNLTKNNLNNHCIDIHGLVVCKYCGIHISSVEKWLYEHLKLNHNFKTIISDYFENTLFTIINEEVTCSLCGDILTSLMDNLEKVIYHYLSYHKLSLNSIGNLLIQNPSMEFNQTVCQIENIKLEANDVEIETPNNEGCPKSLEQKEKNCLCDEKAVSDSPMKEDQTDENEINENISEKSFQSNFDMISDVVDYKIDGYNDINFSEVQCIFSDTSDDAMSDNETLNNKESQNIDKHDCRNKTNTLSESNSSIVLKSLCIKCEVCLSNFDKKDKYIKHLERLHGFKCSNNNESVSDKAVRLNSKYVTVVKKYKNPLYLCLICKTETRSKMLARKHIRSHDFWISEICDSSDIGYKCYFCNDLFWTIENRNVHQIEKHLSLDESIKFMKCYLCTTIFSSKTCLKRHVQVEHESKEEFTSTSYKCMHCHMLYPNLNQIRKHFKDDHPGSKSLYCSFSTCRTKCSSKKVLKNHFKNLHLTQKSSQPQNCEICGKFFKNLRCKQLHVKMKHLNSIKTGFKCRVCDERFETDEKRKEHMEAFHPGVATFFCQYCNKGFRSKSGLSSHRQTHSDLNLICPHCQKSFSRRDSYIEHMLIHNGPRHRCDQCGREFVQRSNLVRHKRIHSGIKPYFCQYCYRGFADKSACSSHERVHTREEVCACPYCNRTFSKKQKLKYHIRIHTGEGLLTCTVCQKTFTSSYSMKKHMETHSRRAISNGKYNKKELERHSDS